MDQATKALAFDLIRTGQASGSCYIWQYSDEIAKLLKTKGQMETIRIMGQLAAIQTAHMLMGSDPESFDIKIPIELSALNVIREAMDLPAVPHDLPGLPGRYTERTIKDPGHYFFYPKHKLSGYERPRYVEIFADSLEPTGEVYPLRCKKYAGVYVGPLVPPSKE